MGGLPPFSTGDSDFAGPIHSKLFEHGPMLKNSGFDGENEPKSSDFR